MTNHSLMLAWWQPLRAGNVFTAISNVLAGFLLVQGDWQQVSPLLLLVAASALLYEAGMVLNNVFDTELDAVERPERPIPSGRISRRKAGTLGAVLLAMGIACGFTASYLTGTIRPGIVAGALALCVVGYDAGLKSTALGPWVMGACRTLNVLLGASCCLPTDSFPSMWYAVVVGLYTVGVTYYALGENQPGWKLSNSIGVCLVVTVTIVIGFWIAKATKMPGLGTSFWLGLNLFLWTGSRNGSGSRAAPALFRSTVARMIAGFVMLDAMMVGGFVNPLLGMLMFLLLVPIWIASRLAPMT